MFLTRIAGLAPAAVNSLQRWMDDGVGASPTEIDLCERDVAR
jgi:hypothetical protein